MRFCAVIWQWWTGALERIMQPAIQQWHVLQYECFSSMAMSC